MFDAYDAAALWDSLPGTMLETLTFGSQLASAQGTYAMYTLYRCRRRGLNKEERISQAALGVQTVVFEIWQQSFANAVPIGGASLPCPVPKTKDRLTDVNGILWLIQDIDVAITGPSTTYAGLRVLRCQKGVGQ